MGLVATAMMAGATGTTTARVTGIGIGTAIVEAAGTAADSIAPTLRDLRRLTGAKMVGLCRTVSANRTGATDTKSLPGCFEVSPLGRTTPYTSVLERRPRENAKGRFPAAFFLLELYD